MIDLRHLTPDPTPVRLCDRYPIMEDQRTIEEGWNSKARCRKKKYGNYWAGTGFSTTTIRVGEGSL